MSNCVESFKEFVRRIDRCLILVERNNEFDRSIVRRLIELRDVLS